MKQLRNLFTHLSLIALTVVSFATGITPAQALTSGSFSFSTAKSTLNVNEQTTISVNVSSTGTPGIGSVRVKVNYDPSKLEFVSASGSGSAFGGSLAEASVPGQYSNSRQAQVAGGVAAGKVVDITFKAIAAGATSLSFAGDSKIWEADSGDEKPVTTNATQAITVNGGGGNPTPTPTPQTAPKINSFTVTPTKVNAGGSATLAWNVDNASSVSINNGVGNVAAKSSGIVKPNATTTYTLTATGPGGTVTKAVTLQVTQATPVATATPVPSTPTPVPTTSSNPGAISLSQSGITFSSTTAVADGVDLINVSINLRREDGSAASDIEPKMTGLRSVGDSASPFVFDEETQEWKTSISSTEVGSTTVTLTAADIALASQEITFTEPDDTVAPVDNDTNGSAFWRYLLIGLGILILLLLILFFLWRRLRKEDDDEYYDETDPNAPAYPGDDSAAEVAPEAAPAPAPAPAEDDNARFSADQALQRSAPPVAAPAEEQKQPDNSIPL